MPDTTAPIIEAEIDSPETRIALLEKANADLTRENKALRSYLVRNGNTLQSVEDTLKGLLRSMQLIAGKDVTV